MRKGWPVGGGVAAAVVVLVALEAQQAEPRRIATAPAFNARYGRPHGDGALMAAVHPADLQFVA